jgi:hypothetical protein
MGQNISSEQTRLLDVVQESDNLDQVLHLLQSYQDKLDLGGEFGTNVLIAACFKGHSMSAEALALAGCNIRSAAAKEQALLPGETGITPLHAAVLGGNAECVSFCIRAGSDLSASTSLNRTASDIAQAAGSQVMARILREASMQQAAFDARRNSAYTKAHLGLNRLHRQAMTVHVIDYIDGDGPTQYLIESEDNFSGKRSLYYAKRTISEFRKLHADLCEEYPCLPATAMPLAPKSLHAAAKRARMYQLQEYLRLVLAHVEQDAGGKFAFFRLGSKKGRSLFELPNSLVDFLSLEDSSAPQSCREPLQQLRLYGYIRPTPTRSLEVPKVPTT